MSAIPAPVTAREQCPLYRLIVSERQSLDAALLRLASGKSPQYQPLNARSRVASLVQYNICRRRVSRERLRASALSHIEEAVNYLPESEQADIFKALAACRAGYTLSG
jgi:DNA helicase HerA-like ATPase